MKPSNPKKPQICLLGVSFTTTNLGVSALGTSCIKGFTENLPDVDIVLLDYGPKEKSRLLNLTGLSVPVERINLSFSKKIWRSDHILRLLTLALFAKLLPARFRTKLMRSNPPLKAITESTLAGAISAGDSFSDIYGIKRFLYVVLPQVLVLLVKGRLILLPQTYGPYKRIVTKALARYIFRRAVAVYSRDLAGMDTVKKLIGPADDKHIHFCPDVAFIMHRRKPKSPQINALLEKIKTNGSVLVGLNVSGLLFNDPAASRKNFNLKADYKELLDGIVESLLADKDVTLMLVPHVVDPDDNTAGDAGPCLELYEKTAQRHTGRVFIAGNIYDQSEIKYVISLCDFFMGSRMHSCIAALSQMVPAVALAYSSKFSGVFDSVGAGDLVVDLRDQPNQRAIASVTEAFRRRHAIASRLSQTVPRAQNQIRKAFSDTCCEKSK